jgi:anti-sigma factor RsiW
MKRCFEDGDLRAFADGELPVESLQEIAGHLETCPSCSARHRELSRRAARVYGLMAGLSEVDHAIQIPRARPRRRWWLATLPLAAALAIAFVRLPHRAPVRPSTVAQATVPAAPLQTAAPAARPAVAHPVAKRRAARRPAPDEEFLRLDDEPIETATIVRVSADSGALQADLIVGPDGRAHAIRVVRNR